MQLVAARKREVTHYTACGAPRDALLCRAHGQARGSPAAVVRDASEPVPALDAGRGRRDRPADDEGAAVRRPGRRGGAEEQFLRPVGGRRACRCGAEVALFASLGEGGGGHLGARPHLLRGREHLHARLLVAPLQGQLLQVHQRDAALPRGGQRAERHPLPGRLQRRHRRRRLRAGARVRRDPAGRRRLLDGLAAGGAAPRRASGHRRPHASGGQAQGAARPGRRLLHPGGGDQREAGGRVGPGRRGGAAQQVRRGDPAAREGAGGRRAGGGARAGHRAGRRRAAGLGRPHRVPPCHAGAGRRRAGGDAHGARPRGRGPQGRGRGARARRGRLGHPRGARVGRRAPAPALPPRGDRPRLAAHRGRSRQGARGRRAAGWSSAQRMDPARDALALAACAAPARRHRPQPLRRGGREVVLRRSTVRAARRSRPELRAGRGRRGSAPRGALRGSASRLERPLAPGDALPRKPRPGEGGDRGGTRGTDRRGAGPPAWPRHRARGRHRLRGGAARRRRGARFLEPRRAHRHGSQLPLPRARDAAHQDLRPPLRLAELDLHPPQRNRRDRRAQLVRQAGAPALRLEEDVVAQALESIPNNVDLSSDRRLQRALEQWQPNFLSWWREDGPEGFQAHQIYLRTAVSVEPDGWATFDYVRMPEYRWGIFLAPKGGERKIGFGDNYGEPAWDEVPGEHRNALRRIIVTQADTEPASVEQQRLLGKVAPSLYDLRNIFQVNVEEGRHLWAMVYLLHRHFGRDGREEAEELLQRRSGNPDKPRILGAFNQPIDNWLDFFMFTMFTDRDGKYQLLALAESGFDPLSRTTRFMLTEEAHHMFVGETGIGRVVQRSAELTRQSKSGDAREQGGIDLATIQKYLNLWYFLSLDLFGSEVSTNAASFFGAGLKGRAKEEKFADHIALQGFYPMELPASDSKLQLEQVPLRSAMNEVLRDAYVEDCQRGVDRWNKTLGESGLSERLSLPSRRFHRHQGAFAGMPVDPQGKLLAREEWARRRDEWIPSAADKAYVKSLQARPITQPGQMAQWIAAPPRGINNQPLDFVYVRTEA